MKRLTPHQRIMRASERGTGCRLSAEDCEALAGDHAIMQRAADDDEMAKLPDDEADHYECFEPGPMCGVAFCIGDGWYRCPECRKYNSETEVGW